MKQKVHGFITSLEKVEDWYVAKVPALQGCATQGKTTQKALQRIKEAIEVCTTKTLPSYS